MDNTASSIVNAIDAIELRVYRAGMQIRLEWDGTLELALEHTDAVGSSARWLPIEAAPVLINGLWEFTVAPATRSQFYRLTSP